MDREVDLAVLLALVAGPLLILCGLLPWRGRMNYGPSCERVAWRALWTPAVAPLAGGGWLLGWAASEPALAEVLPVSLFLLSFGVLVIWLRAVGRGVRAAAAKPTGPAFTYGLLRPLVAISRPFSSLLEAPALAAVLAHEAAHARHRDPLRILIAQLWTDLQWPSRAAITRYTTWRTALEMARDDEARRAGVAGEDLAEALLAALSTPEFAVAGVLAPYGGLRSAESVRRRLHRLLAPLSPSGREPAPPYSTYIPVGLIAASTARGVLWGETVIRLLLLR